MKKVMTIVLAAVLGTNAMAVGFLGSPTAELGQGKWSFGYDYSYSSQDTAKVNAKSTTFPQYRFNIHDFNLNRHYAAIGYGLTDDWDIYVKFGFADLKALGRDYTNNSEWGMNFDNDFAWGWGTRYTFARQDNIEWGAAFQMNWMDTEFSKFESGDLGGGITFTGNQQYSLDSYDILISAGPTVNMGNWKFYGGPFYYYLDGDYKSNDVIVTSVPDTFINTETADVEAGSNFGGFIGAVFNLSKNCDWTVEYNMTGKGWGVGTGIAWKF